MRRTRGALALLALLAFCACSGGGVPTNEADIAAKVIDLERKLTTSCACHPRKIAGLPIQAAIRADLRTWIKEGRDEHDILWLGFSRYGSELLAAGIADLEGRVRQALWVTLFIVLAGLSLLVANLRGGAVTDGPASNGADS